MPRRDLPPDKVRAWVTSGCYDCGETVVFVAQNQFIPSGGLPAHEKLYPREMVEEFELLRAKLTECGKRLEAYGA
jgi:hypothetical protein